MCASRDLKSWVCARASAEARVPILRVSGGVVGGLEGEVSSAIEDWWR